MIKNNFIYILFIVTLLFSCTPMEEIIYFNKIYNIETATPSYKQHVIKEGDLLDIKILSNNENIFKIFNL